MEKSFKEFLDIYLDSWRASSLSKIKHVISTEYKAREITNGEINDFGYQESIKGWEMGFHFVTENKAEWDLKVNSIIPLRENEILVILSASLDIRGESSKTANLFFQTFKKQSTDEWKLVRSYIEAGITKENDAKNFTI